MKSTFNHIRIILIILVLSFAAVFNASAQQNPFLSTGEPQPVPESSQEIKSNPIYDSAFMGGIRNAQKRFQAWISEYIAEYRSTGDIKTLFRFLLFSYLYGLLHVLGPGHRKIFLFSYFISQPSRWRQGMFAGFMTAVLHAVSAVILIGGLYAVTSRALYSRFNNFTPLIEAICYGAIIAIGAGIIISHIVSSLRKTGHEAPRESSYNTILFIVVSGLVPCPGAATIMIFSIAVQAPLTGIYAVIAMSLGMASITTLVPPAAILFRSRITPMLTRWNPETGEKIHNILSIAGAAVLILLGLFFLV